MEPQCILLEAIIPWVLKPRRFSDLSCERLISQEVSTFPLMFLVITVEESEENIEEVFRFKQVWV